jgi:hypothetical protein
VSNIIRNLDDPALFQPWFSGDSWNAWRSVLKGAFALPMTPEELATFKLLADRDPPAAPVRELWVVAGRRCGKDSIGSLIATQLAAFSDYLDRLRPGERALVMCLACDREQAKIVLGYTKAYFEQNPLLGAMVTRETANGLELSNGAEIAVHTNSFRAVRGRTVVCAIFDEVAYWRDENSASPDREVYNAVRPGLSTLPGSLLIGISTPFKRSGLLYDKWRQHYGQPGDVLVIKAPSKALYPLLDQAIIDADLEADPEAAAAEWLGEFRSDLADFVDRQVVERLVVPGRYQLPKLADLRHTGFADPSGGSSDSFSMAIAHFDNGCAILDVVDERKPPFSPEEVIADFSKVFHAYDIQEIVTDRYGGEFPVELFRKNAITVVPSERPKSDIYKELLPMLNSGKVELLDNPRLIAQLCSLERRTIRGGRDSIDHPANGHDDLINSAAGALVRASGEAFDPAYWTRVGVGFDRLLHHMEQIWRAEGKLH